MFGQKKLNCVYAANLGGYNKWVKELQQSRGAGMVKGHCDQGRPAPPAPMGRQLLTRHDHRQ